MLFIHQSLQIVCKLVTTRQFKESYALVKFLDGNGLAPVVQTLDSAIQRINHYPADSVIDFRNTYPLDSDLSGLSCSKGG